MNYLKTYKIFLEDGGSSGSGDGGNAYATANVSGMGGVISAQPGGLPGTTGSDGSGDVSFTFKKKKRKKGKPSEVSDLRDLKKVDVDKVKDIKEMSYIKKFESYYTDDDIIYEIVNELKSRNFSPLEINKIVDSFTPTIQRLKDKGKPVKLIIDTILGLLPNTIDDKFLKVNKSKSSWRNISYL